jgi:hypothetical protein
MARCCRDGWRLSRISARPICSGLSCRFFLLIRLVLMTAVFHKKALARVLPQSVAHATVSVCGVSEVREGVMRGVAALPMSVVGVLIFTSIAWACGDFDRPGDACGRDHRGPPGISGPPGPRFDRPGKDPGEWAERFARDKGERDRVEKDKIRREVEEEANAIIEEGMRKADEKMREAIALRRNTETLQAYLSEEVAKAKKAQEDAAQHQREADDRAKQADDRTKQADEAKRGADEQARLLKADRDRQEARLVELLALDPCGGGRRAEAGH